MQEVTDGQRFCVRCGTALEVGRCPYHGSDVAPRASAPAPIAPPAQHNAWMVPPIAPIWPPAVLPREEPPPTPHRSGRSAPSVTMWVAAAIGALLLIVLIADQLYLQHAVSGDHHSVRQLEQRLAAQETVTNALAKRVGVLEGNSDPAAVAAMVQASVFTIDTPDGLGSGWVVSASGGSSLIVTDYHVIQAVWTGSGPHTVQVEQNATDLTGTISKVDPGDDLAVVTVNQAFTPLSRATTGAMVGDEVLVVGSPLGLSGTVSNGIVSSFRNGLVQFSAPISPGDSGGPVVDQQGHVIGVAESKLVGNGVEGLSFAIPVATVCSTVATC